MFNALIMEICTDNQSQHIYWDIFPIEWPSGFKIRLGSIHQPFFTRCSFVRLCKQDAFARPCERSNPTAMANFSFRSAGHRLMYWRSVGKDDSSSGFCKYLYLANYQIESKFVCYHLCYLLMSLARTSTYFFISSICTGYLALIIANGEFGPSSR